MIAGFQLNSTVFPAATLPERRCTGGRRDAGGLGLHFVDFDIGVPLAKLTLPDLHIIKGESYGLEQHPN